METGAWTRLLGGVISAQPTALPPLGRAWAATLAWPEAIVCRGTAALLWGLPLADDGLCHVVARHGRHARGMTVHLVEPDPSDVVRPDRRPAMTSLRRTILDCLATLPVPEALDLHAWTATRRLLSRRDLVREAEQRHGRHGVVQLRDLVDLTSSGAVSAAEHMFHRLLVDAGIGGWTAGGEVFDATGLIGVVDVLFVDQRLVVEVDGLKAHSGYDAFVADRRRQNRIVNAGYRILRFTWWDLTDRPADVVTEIRRALAGVQ